MQYGVLSFLDVAFEGIIPRAFALGHMLYGGMVGVTLTLARPRRRRLDTAAARAA